MRHWMRVVRGMIRMGLTFSAGVGAAASAVAGLLLFGALALNAWDAWSLSTAMANATIFVVLGGGSATGILILARRAAPALAPGVDTLELDPGEGEGREDSS